MTSHNNRLYNTDCISDILDGKKGEKNEVEAEKSFVTKASAFKGL